MPLQLDGRYVTDDAVREQLGGAPTYQDSKSRGEKRPASSIKAMDKIYFPYRETMRNVKERFCCSCRL